MQRLVTFVYARGQNAVTLSARRAGATPQTFGRLKAVKVGSLPPNLVFFSVSLLPFSYRLFPRFPATYAHHKEKKMVKTRLK
jgi:hypothetical protein